MENQKNIEKSLVERDSEGLPRAWRLFTVGDNIVTDQEGDGTLRMKKEDIDTIVERFETKGLEIPVDGDHYLEHLAKEKGMDADELVKSSPYKEGEGTLGFGKLEKREDGLWLSVEKWNEDHWEIVSMHRDGMAYRDRQRQFKDNKKTRLRSSNKRGSTQTGNQAP